LSGKRKELIMKKVLVVVCLGILLFAGTAIGQNWGFDKILYDQGIPIDDGYGIHGVVVAPDGNIWICMNGAFHEGLYPDDWFLYGAEQDTAYYRPLYILDPTTGDHVSFSPLKVLIFADGTHDTLHTLSPINGSGKGMSLDNDGNILYSSWSTIYRINYQTGEGMNYFFTGDAGLPATSLTEPVQDANGLIYCSYVSGSGRPIFMLDNDFNYIGNAADDFGHLNRTFVVSPDGKDLYAGSTWNGMGIEHWHSEIPGVLQYTPIDTFGNWDSIYVETEDTTYWAYDVKLWPECLDWGPDGNLWAGGTKEEWVTPGTGSRFFVFDVTTKERLYSVGTPGDTLGDPYAGEMMTPRGAACSADGKTMYLADYNYGTIGVWTLQVGDWIKSDIPDYTYDGIFDEECFQPHGVAVDNSGRVWIGSYGAAGLIVKNADGTHASFSPINSVTVDGEAITLDDGNCRGMKVDHEGNILYCKGATLLKINATTGAGMAKWDGAGSLTKPGVDENGLIYVGTVVGVSPITVLDASFNVVMTSELTPAPSYARGIAVSADGKDLYSANLSAGGPVYHYHSDVPGLTAFTYVDSLYLDSDGDNVFNYQTVTVDFGPNNTIWVSDDDAYAATGQPDNGLVVFDLTTKEYGLLAMPLDSTEYNGPRGVAFSADGEYAYVASFNASRVFRFKAGVGVEERTIAKVPAGFELKNYPNPFNSATNISFAIPKSGLVELKVYDVLGREVKTLLSESMVAGKYNVTFNATDMAAGIYYYRLVSDNQAITKKMLIIK
jgi:sugar lactone lactonase YvrE